MSLNENVFNTGKNYCATKIVFARKTPLPSTSKIPSTTKSLLLGRKTNGSNFSHWKKLLCYENHFLHEKAFAVYVKNSLLNYVVGLFSIKY